MGRRALIIGITGQDGAYLARRLLHLGYSVTGTSRDARPSSLGGLERLGVRERVEVVQMAPTDFRSVIQTLTDVAPDEIYNLSGQSSVAASFAQPIDTLESVMVATGNILESIRFLKIDDRVRFYNACSSECFGDTAGAPADESTPFHPLSPYAVAKSAAFWLVANYRRAYKLFACSGILFNHESPLRSERFVTRKIISAAVGISRGSADRLRLGNIEVARDWGWAPEFVEAMRLMLQAPEPRDFVIATGHTVTLRHFIQRAFEYVDLDWRAHTEVDARLLRPSDMSVSCANPARAEAELGWKAEVLVDETIRRLIDDELQRR